MLSKREYEDLDYKEKNIYEACLLKFRNNWSTIEMSKELKISRTTAYRWLTEYLFYIDNDLYKKVQTQLTHNRKIWRDKKID